MIVQKFRKRPVVVSAKQLTKDNMDEVANWMAWLGSPPATVQLEALGRGLLILTTEGAMLASIGDWVIRGEHGEFYPCKPDVFAAVYEPAYGVAPDADDLPIVDNTCSDRACRSKGTYDLHGACGNCGTRVIGRFTKGHEASWDSGKCPTCGNHRWTWRRDGRGAE
ncbi:MAG: hypothetical protein KGL39_16535 [Patescibacteria group bacterium]|nr:hypothetical protein [Patescibacteria group bacterium]